MDAIRYTWNDLAADSPMEKIVRRRVIGSRVMISRVELAAGFSVASHRHDNEQIAVIESGRIRFVLGEPGQEEELELVGGEVLHLPPGVPHGATAIEDTVVLDVFSPPSEKTGVDQS